MLVLIVDRGGDVGRGRALLGGVDDRAQRVGLVVLLARDPAAPVVLLDRRQQLRRGRDLVAHLGDLEPVRERELHQLAVALRDRRLLRIVGRVDDPRRIGLVDRAERVAELVEEQAGLLVAAARVEGVARVLDRHVGVQLVERGGLRVVVVAAQHDVAAEQLGGAELVERVGRIRRRRREADHPGHVLGGRGLLERGEGLAQRRVGRAVIPLDDVGQLEPDAEHRREQRVRVVELVGDVVLPLRRLRPVVGVGVGADLGDLDLAFVLRAGIEIRGHDLGEIGVRVLHRLRARAGAGGQDGSGDDGDPAHGRRMAGRRGRRHRVTVGA